MTIETLTVESISSATVEALSRAKGEPAWMLELRRKAWRFFEEIPWPTGTEETWRRTRLTGFKLEEYTPLTGTGVPASVPENVSKSLAEIESAGSLAFVNGAPAQSKLSEELASKGVIFTDLGTAVRAYP